MEQAQRLLKLLLPGSEVYVIEVSYSLSEDAPVADRLAGYWVMLPNDWDEVNRDSFPSSGAFGDFQYQEGKAKVITILRKPVVSPPEVRRYVFSLADH